MTEIVPYEIDLTFPACPVVNSKWWNDYIISGIYANLVIDDTPLVTFKGNLKFQGDAGFYPVKVSQSTQPTPDTGELIIWRDTDDGKIYLVYNDSDSGVKQTEMV